MTFRKILCAIDFSAGSHEALRLATQMCSAETELVLVHVWQPFAHTYGSEAGFTPDLVENIQASAERELAKAKRDAERQGGSRVDTLFRIGLPWREIVRALEEDRGFDLAVVGTHGRTGLSHLLLGSVAERVVRHASCPVLVARVRASSPAG